MSSKKLPSGGPYEDFGWVETLERSSQTGRPPILAVSGGIDSMTLMWLFRKTPGAVVAHFNHGTRPSADEDEEFVRREASRYGLPFISEKAELGEGVSESEAREARYKFLERVAEEYGGEIFVAHHLNDVIESIAINLLRGTGWRGLAVMGSQKIRRPMISVTKSQIYQLAAKEQLHFRQDPTNTEDYYLRNRVREKLFGLTDEAREKLGRLYERQVELANEVDRIVGELLPEDGIYLREWFVDLDDGVALEILRKGLMLAGISATRPQMLDFLEAIRTYAPEKAFNLPGGKLVTLHKTYFVL